MLGLMQAWPLLCGKILDHAATYHGERSLVSRSIEGPIEATTYQAMHLRSKMASSAFSAEGIRLGDRVATLAWNTTRHMEVWYGLLGIGAIYHTLNPRLFPDQIAWIINHAGDRLLVADLTFIPIIEAIEDKIPTIEKIIILTDEAHLPENSLKKPLIAYEEWIAEGDDDFNWLEFDENTAAGMCYTSGTTGDPKGVVYSHRSNVLHALAANVPDMLGLSCRDVVMPVVPLFHANGWSLAFSAPLVGAALVMPGARMDGEAIYELLDRHKVTITAAVPTVWLMLLSYLEETGKKLPLLERVVIGGSAAPRSMIEAFETRYDVRVIHAWGMTEMSPLGSLCTLKPEYDGLSADERLGLQEKQGHPPFTIEMKITDDNNMEMPRDGKSFGRLKVRGPSIAKEYYGGAGAEQFDADGWFDTGDVATLNEHGYMQITDRSKDVIKSGGEWISSIEIENIAVGHPKVAEAAVIGIPHPKWDERPLLVIVARDGETPDDEDVLSFLDGKIAKWWRPDGVAIVEEIPHTATGKIQKTTLREQFRDFRFPSVDP